MNLRHLLPGAGAGRWVSTCPDWCARGHHCTAGYPTGEHRSEPGVFNTPYGRLVATRIEHATTGAGRFEVRAVLRLPPNTPTARTRAANALVRTDLAIRAALGLPTRPARRP